MKPFSLFYVRFPAGCEGMVYGITGVDNEGNYTVAIDSAQDEETQKFALKHELSHIHLGHFDPDNKKPISEIEQEADKHAEQMTEEELNFLLTFCRKKEVKPPGFMEEYEAKKANAQPA